jgi:cobalamin biosynthesis protein CbiG
VNRKRGQTPPSSPALQRGLRRSEVPKGGQTPLRFVVGVGCSLGCSVGELLALVDGALEGLGGELGALATVDRRAGEPGVVAAADARGVPLLTYTAQELAAVEVPTPSAVVARHVGTPSVAEAAALLGGGRLVVRKQRSEHATCAVATWPE